jgi:signal transduction histidine kinase
MATVGDDAVRALTDRLLNVLAAQQSLTTQRVLAAAPDYADSAELQTKVAKAAGAEAAAIDRLTQLTPAGERAKLPGASDLQRNQYQPLAQQLSSDLERTVHARANTLRSAALRDTAIILGAVLTALVVALGVGRSLIRSISGLRRGALQVAQVQLPEEIERLSKGDRVPEITALPVHTKEEMGQLARAIDDIHFQAVRLAGEHGVRLQIGEMFETLSRRSRSLVEEQLLLIETLEHDEDDPVRLDHLFRLDHLVTRMRRNGDNLLVLADTVERHRRSGPVPLPEVLRAAMSEVEQYRRVTLGPTGDVSIVGAAAGDVGHLIAELLDNALRYSPPESAVSVTVSRAVDAGILVEVADRGLGMSAEDVNAANERLALGGEVTSETAKRMGLFVVGRLARRHEVVVRLRPTDALSAQPGVTVSVYLPGALVAASAEIVDTLDDPLKPIEHRRLPDRELANVFDATAVSAPADAVVSSVPTHNGSTLPKRSPGASGVNGVARTNGRTAAVPEPTSNSFAYFTNRTPREAQQNIEDSDDAPIFDRMVSEWLMDPTTLESRDGVWATAADAGWAAAADAVEQKPQRHTETGLPIRERGARLVPGHARKETDAETDTGRDPAAVGNLLSRAMAGVRSGRAESIAAHRKIEGDG